MTISYLLSILDLYLLKEGNNKLLIFVDNHENVVKFNFTYSFDSINQTFVKIDKTLFFANLEIISKKIIGNLELTLENYDKSIYTMNFDNKRVVTFKGFQKEEMIKIRDSFNLLDDFTFDIKDTNYQDVKLTSSLKLSMGFTNYMSLFLSSIFFLDILMISLWIFKAFLR